MTEDEREVTLRLCASLEYLEGWFRRHDMLAMAEALKESHDAARELLDEGQPS